MVALQDTFLSVWYWIFAILFWGVIGNYTFGIPNELLTRSTRSKEEGEIFERYARRNLAMFARAIRKRSFIVTMITAFVLAVIATFAFWRGEELAMGALVILGPMAALWTWGGWMIRKLDAERPPLDRLRAEFMKERRLTGFVAAASMLLAMWTASRWHGPGWTEALFRGF